MHGDRTITKYTNRRLYDSLEARYVTLAHVRKLVNEHVDFSVIDRRTGTDITWPVLLQVMTVHEAETLLVFPKEFLLDVIRLCGSPEKDQVRVYLDQALAALLNDTTGAQVEGSPEAGVHRAAASTL